MASIDKQTQISLGLALGALGVVFMFNRSLISAAEEIRSSLGVTITAIGEKVGSIEKENAGNKEHFRAIESQFLSMGHDIAAIKELMLNNASEVPELKAQVHYLEVRIEAIENQ